MNLRHLLILACAHASCTDRLLLLGRLPADFGAAITARLLRQGRGPFLPTDRVAEGTLRVVVRAFDGSHQAKLVRRVARVSLTDRIFQFCLPWPLRFHGFARNF